MYNFKFSLSNFYRKNTLFNTSSLPKSSPNPLS